MVRLAWQAACLLLRAGVCAASYPPFELSIPTKSIGTDVNGTVVNIPMAGMGTKGYNDSVAENAVVAALAAGVRLIDTAYTYGCQVGVANGIKKSGVARSALFITAKVPGGLDQATTIAMHEKNLRQLGVTTVDLLLTEYPCATPSAPSTPPTNCSKQHRQDTWKALESLYTSGKARAIGVSHYCKAHLQDILDIKTVPISVNQQEWHVGMGADPEGVVSFCKKNSIVYQSFSPLCGECDAKSQQELLYGDLTTSIGQSHKATGAQVALRWLVESGSPVIPRTTNATHLGEDLDLFGSNWANGLSATELSNLNAATSPASHQPVSADCNRSAAASIIV